jgi:hypothetical protein
MNKTSVTKTQGEKPTPGSDGHYVLSAGDYTYSSIWGGDASGAFGLPAGRRRGWFAVPLSRGLRAVRRCSRGVAGGVGVSGLMSSNVPINMRLSLQLFIVYIGSQENTLGRMLGRVKPRVWSIWLLSGCLCENQPEITGQY